MSRKKLVNKRDFLPGNTFFGNLGKFLGAGLGWGVGGPVVGIIGFVIGYIIDETVSLFRSSSAENRFISNMLVLMAAVMKANGNVRKAELEYVKFFLIRNFGRQGAVKALGMLRNILKQDISLSSVCLQVKESMKYSSRLQLMYVLVNIANIDNYFDAAEKLVLESIAKQIGINAVDRDSIRAMFVEDTHKAYSGRPSRQPASYTLLQAYKILGVDRNADIATIKKTYRAMALKHHPDKAAYLGEDIKKAANEKFQHLNEAYRLIKNDKGFV